MPRCEDPAASLERPGMDEFPPAPLNATARVVTTMVFLLTAFFVFLVFRHPCSHPFAAVPMLLVPAVSWGLSIRNYSLEDGKLVIHRPIASRRIALSPELTAYLDPDAARGALKLSGNGGIFGYQGVFRNGRLGNFSAYATDWEFGVVVKTGGKTFVLTPEDPVAFMARLRETADSLK